MKKPKSIVLLGYLKGFGGAERSMIMLSNALAKLGYRVTVISLGNNDIAYEIDNKVEYILIKNCGKSKIENLINKFIELKDILYNKNPDIVISFWLQPAIYSAILSKFIGFKNIYAERGDPTDKEYDGLLGLVRNIVFNYVDGFVFQTEGAKNCFKKCIQRKGRVINNPVYIDYDDYEVPKYRRKSIVNVGRLHEQKNQELLINSFAKVSKLFPEYKLEIYGDGPLKSKLELQIKKLDLQEKVILKGTRKKLFEEIVDASLFILSSDYEGMPNALMEAMALGIPCISTDCKPGGARELIKNRYNGIICSVGCEDELSDNIKFMLENKKIANELGLRGKNICNTNSMNNIFNKWENYIIQIYNK